MSKSSWELVSEELLNIFTWRLRVPGGWLYRRGNTDRMTFVPDAEPDVPDRLIPQEAPFDAREALRQMVGELFGSMSTREDP